MAALCADIPTASFAATLKLNVVEGVRPDTEKLVVVELPITAPF
jgi:hypothetical protein